MIPHPEPINIQAQSTITNETHRHILTYVPNRTNGQINNILVPPKTPMYQIIGGALK